MPGTITASFAGSSSYASVRLRRAELVLMAMMVALFVVTVSVGAKLAYDVAGYGVPAQMEIVLEGNEAPEADNY